MKKTLLALLTVLALAPLVPQTARAQTLSSFHVSLAAGPLQGLGNFYLDFQFLDGSGTGDNNARATVSGLSITGGNLLTGSATYNGSASGQPDQSGGLVLTDSDPGGVAEFTQRFGIGSPTARIDFDLSVNAASLDTFGPDEFNFLILQTDGSTPLPTNGPNGAELLSLVLDQNSPLPGTYATSSSSPVALSAPAISSTNAPEPSTVALVFTAAVFLPFPAVIRRRHRIRSQETVRL